jgi:hypothetical protein
LLAHIHKTEPFRITKEWFFGVRLLVIVHGPKRPFCPRDPTLANIGSDLGGRLHNGINYSWPLL